MTARFYCSPCGRYEPCSDCAPVPRDRLREACQRLGAALEIGETFDGRMAVVITKEDEREDPVWELKVFGATAQEAEDRFHALAAALPTSGERP